MIGLLTWSHEGKIWLLVTWGRSLSKCKSSKNIVQYSFKQAVWTRYRLNKSEFCFELESHLHVSHVCKYSQIQQTDKTRLTPSDSDRGLSAYSKVLLSAFVSKKDNSVYQEHTYNLKEGWQSRRWWVVLLGWWKDSVSCWIQICLVNVRPRQTHAWSLLVVWWLCP